MKRIHMLNRIQPDLILATLLRPDQIVIVQNDVKLFFKEQHNLPPGVLNAILIKAIIGTGEKLFNLVYLRMVTETFKAEGITATSLAVNKLEKDFSQAKQRKRKSSQVETQKVSEPSFMTDEFMAKLVKMD